MARFIVDSDLNAELEKIIKGAEKHLFLISPFIKLHDRLKSILKTKLEEHKLEITIVFGKNEDNFSKSFSEDDFNFFKEFPNIQIRYEKRLHAKYYANEKAALLTSMNLYSYSQDNNIEAGIIMKTGFVAENIDKDAWEYFGGVVDQSELLFEKIPEYKSTTLGLSEKYIESKIDTDKLTERFTKGSTLQPKGKVPGFCISTGVSIPFNPKQPMAPEAYKAWKSKSNNPLLVQNFCHFSGEPGETSLTKPILRKNWSKAKELFGF